MAFALDMVRNNPAFQEHLVLMEAYPPDLETHWEVKPSLEAARALKETNLEEWVERATYRPRED